MSEVIDQRTVEMRFDNQNFEKNVESSLGTIDKLKKSLNFQDSVKGIEVFEKSLNSLNLKNVRESVDGVTDSFHNMMKTITNVYLIRKGVEAFNDLENAAKNVVKSMAGINNMKAGWGKYESKVTSVQTIMNATGRTIDDVSRALDKLNWYSDETSASFTDMVDNIGKFTSAGVKLEDATAAMQGVFNWASTSGGNKNQAARAMYNLSQAISVGSMKLMDWKSIENANMSTVEFKQTVLDTGVALGKLIKTGDKYYTKIGKKQEISAKNFNSTLSTGWLDSELLVSVLKRYAEFSDKVYEYMGEHSEFDTAKKAMDAMREETLKSGKAFDDLGYKWFRAAQEAKTFTDVVESIKDAASTGWMKTFEYIFGNYEQARLMWSDLAEDLFDVFIKPLNKQNDFIKDALTSNYSKLKEVIVDAGLSVEEFEERVYNSTKTNEDNRAELDRLILKYGNLSNAIDAGQVSSELIRKAFVQLSESGEEVEKTIPTLKEVEQIIKDTWSGKYGNGEERYEAYRNLGYEAEKLQKLVTVFTKKGKLELTDLEEVGIEVGQAYSKTWKELIDANKDLIDSLDELSGRELLIGSFRNALLSLFKGVTAFREGIETVFGVSPDSAKNLLQNVYKVTSAFALSDERAEQFKELVVAMGQPLKSVGVVAKKFIGGLIGDSFDGLIPKTQKYFGTAFDSIYTFQRRAAKVFKSLEDSAYVNKAVKRFSEAVNNFSIDAGIKFGELGTKIQGYFQKTFVGSAIRKYATRWSSIWAEMNTGGQNAFDTLIRAGKEFRKQWIDSHGEDWNFFSSLKNGIQRDFEKFKASKLFENIRKPFDSLYKKIDKLFGKKQPEGVRGGLTGKGSFFGNLIQSIQNGMQLLKTSLTEGWFSNQLKTVGTAYQRAVKAFKNAFAKDENNVFDSIKAGLNAFWKTLKYGTKGKHSKFGEAIEKVFGDLLPKDSFISKLIGGIKEKFSSIADAISSIFKKDQKGIKGNLGSVDGGFLDQFREKLTNFWNWAKPLLQTMAETFAKSFNLQNLAAFITALAGFNLSQIGTGFKNFLKSLSGQTGDFLKEYSGILDNVKNYKLTDRLRETISSIVDGFSPLKDTKRELKARSILEFATALGIVAGALYLISGISTPDLIKAGVVIGVIAASLAGIGVLISNLGNIKFEVALSGTGQMLKLIALILAISIALRNVGKAAQGIAKAVDMLIGAVEKFSDLATNKVKFQEGIRAVQDLILALGAASGLAGLGLGNLFGGTALTILAFAAAIRILYDAVEKITTLSLAAPENLDQSIKAIGELIMKLGQSAALAGLTNGSWKDTGAAETILALTGAIEILQNAVFAFAAIPAKKLENSVNAINNLLNTLGKASFWSGFLSNGLGGIGRAATILAFGKSIGILVESVESIMKLSVKKERFELALDTVKGILKTIQWMSIVLGVANRFGAGVSLSQAAGIIAFGAAIKIIGESIAELGKLNKERLIQGGNAVGLIGVLIAGFTSVLGVVNKFLNLSIKELGSAAMIIAFGTAISSIASTVIKLGELDADKMKKGLDATWSIAGVVAGLTAVSSVFNKGTKFSGANFLTIATGIYIFGQAIEKLGGLDDKTLLKGGAAVSALAIVIASCIALMNVGAKIPSWTNAVNIAALAGAVWVLADAAKTFASMDGRQLAKAAVSVGSLLVALTFLSRVGLASGNLGTLLNAASLLVIAGAVSLLAKIAQSFAEMEWPQLGKAGAAMAGMVIAMVAMSKFVKIGSKISFGDVLKFGGIVAEVALILAALGAAMKIPFVDELLTKGGDLLGKLGEAIGKFLGGITSGTAEGVKTMLGQLGAGLGDFADKGKPFFDLMQSMKDVNIGETLLAIMGAETLALVNSALNDWLDLFNGNTFKELFGQKADRFGHLGEFGQGLSALAPGLSAFAEAVSGADITNLPTVTSSLYELNKISRQQQNVNGNPLNEFAKSIKKASTTITEAVNSLNATPKLNNNGSAAIKALSELAAIKMPSTVDVGGNMEGTFITFWATFKQTFSQFAADLSGSSEDFKTFIEATNGLEIEKFDDGTAKVTALTGIIKALAEIDLPPSGGLFTIAWKDYSSVFSNMAGDLDKSMGSFSEFFKKVNKLGTVPDENDLPNMDLIGNVIDIISKMSLIEPKIMPDDMLIQSIGAMVEEFNTAVVNMGTLSETIRESGLTNITDLLSFLDADQGKTINTSFLDQAPDKLRAFVDNIKGITIDESLTAGLQSVVDLLSPLEGLPEFGFTEVASDITSGISKLASINQDNGDNDLLAASGTIAAFSTFAKRINSLQNGFSSTKFSENVGKIFESFNAGVGKLKAQNIGKLYAIEQFFTSMKDLFELKFTKESETGVDFLEEAFTTLSDAIDNFAPQTGYEDLLNYTNLIENLSGKKDMFKQAGEAIGAFAVDADKLNSVTSFMDALKGEFNFTPGDSIFKTDPGETGGHWEKMAGYFSKVANDIVLALTILKGSEKNPVDFTEFDTLTSKLSSLATAMSQFTGTNNVSEKMRDLVKGINDAILGDGTDENPGIKDFGDKLSQFDALQPVFGQLSDWDFNGLKDVVPNILSGISNAINNFRFDPAGIQLLKDAMTGIREALDMLNNDESVLGGTGTKNSLSGRGTGRNRISKADQLAEKIGNRQTTDLQLAEFADAINEADIDPSKADILINVATSIAEAAEGVSKQNPGAMVKFVEVLANSISDNSDITSEAADILMQDIMTVLENYIEKFIAAGVNFVKAIASGIENTPDAVEMAATMATRILTQFTLAAETFGGQKGKEMLDSVLGGLTSPESKEAVSSAFESLFGEDENAEIGVTAENGPVGTQIGANFARDFMEGFTSNLTFGEDENFGGIFQIVSDLLSQLETMDGDQAGMEFGTFMTDFSDSIAKVMEGDAGQEIQATCDEISNVIGGAVPDGEGLGYSFVEGIRDGLLRGIADFGAEIAALAGQLGGLMNSGTATAIKSASPSKTAMRLGEYFVEGLKLGIDKNLSKAYGAGESVGNATVSGTKKTLDNVFVNNEGLKDGLKTLSRINDSTKTAGYTKKETSRMSSVWDLDEIKVGLTKDAIYSLSEQQSSLFSSSVNKIIDGTAQSTKHTRDASMDSSDSKNSNSGGNVYNFNQNIVGSKAASRAEIYRQTKNQFSQLKAMDNKAIPYAIVSA